jgi:multidrug efflux pump
VGHWARRVAGRLAADPALRNVAFENQEGGLRALITVDREVAGRLGVTMQAVNDTLYSAFGQRQISTIYGQANQFRVILEAAPAYQTSPDALSKLYVPGSGGAQVPLSAFSRMERTTAPLSVAHQEQFPAATISFDIAPSAALSAAIEGVARAEEDVDLPSSVVSSFTGDAAEFRRSLEGQPWLILAAAVAIYIVLGILYESFITRSRSCPPCRPPGSARFSP